MSIRYVVDHFFHSSRTDGVIGPSAAGGSEQRLKQLLRAGLAETKRQEARKTPMPTSVNSSRYYTPANEGAKKARELQQVKRRELVGSGRRPTPVAGIHPTVFLIVTLAPNENEPVEFDGTFWHDELVPFYEPTDEVPERPYRAMFRLLAMTYLHNEIYRNNGDLGDSDILDYVEIDTSGDALANVLEAVQDEIKTEEHWRAMFEVFVKAKILRVDEGRVGDQTVLQFTFVRAELDEWIAKNMATLKKDAERSRDDDGWDGWP